MHKVMFRRSGGEKLSAPLQVRSAGSYSVSPPWKDKPLKKSFLQLFWCISGSGEFFLNGRNHILSPGECWFYLPGDLHKIRALSGVWKYRWLTIDGENVWQLIENFNLKRGKIFSGKCPESLFENLFVHLASGNTRSSYLAGCVAYTILSTAIAGTIPEANRLEQIKELISRRFHEPHFSIESIADTLHIHRSTLNRLMREKCNCSALEYLLTFRLDTAYALIMESTMDFKNIAANTGFSSSNYFSRSIRRRFGKTPSQLRRERDQKAGNRF